MDGRCRRLALAAGLLLTAACGGPSSVVHVAGELRLVGAGDPAGLAKDHTLIGKPLTVHTWEICTVGGPVRIRGIRTVRASAMRIVDWGVRSYPPGSGAGERYGYARDVPGFTRRPVTSPCTSKTGSTELDVTVELSADTGVTHGFRIDYDRRHLFVPDRLLLCRRACPPELFKAPLP